MSLRQVAFVLFASILGLLAISAEDPSAANQDILDSLKPDQPVLLKEVGPAYELRFTEEGVPAAHIVAEVGSEYVAVRDLVGTTEIRIPITSIRAVHVRRLDPNR